MGKEGDLIFARWTIAVLVILVVTCSLSGPANCQTNDVALCLQQTPPQGGTVSPGTGVHHFEGNTDVALTAVPNPGYQFVYWLGDVSDPKASSTGVYLDAPKIIVAVFERAEFELAPFEQEPSSGAGGGRGNAADYARTAGGGGGGRRPHKFRPPRKPPEEEEPEDFPVPETGEDFPVPEVPEPSTAVLLTLGSLLTFVRRPATRQAQLLSIKP